MSKPREKSKYVQQAYPTPFVRGKATQSKEIRFMKNRNSIFTTSILVLAGFSLSPVAQARQQSEDRGNGNSAAENVDALNLSTTGANNTVHGWFSLFSNTTGSSNTADGFQALFSNTIGNLNTAQGFQALFSNTEGGANTANGTFALLNNTTGFGNTATGLSALSRNTTGAQSTATGFQALQLNTTGSNNAATGASALESNTTGNQNTATGFNALLRNTTGDANTATGFQALIRNTIGFNNTAIGAGALEFLTQGESNTAIGRSALPSTTTGSFNIGLGDRAGASVSLASNVICIGNNVGGENVSDGCYIGNIFQRPVDLNTALQVFVDSHGKLGTPFSSRRFKRDIKPMDKASEAILALRPVTFHYKSDAKNTPCVGLIAEEVAAVNPDLVVRGGDGEILSVRYDQVNAMLLNEFLKEHKKVHEQGGMITELKKEITALTATVKEQATQIQRVSATLELSRRGQQTVFNNQ
jgi:trimeric autotransporter adhesin